MLTLDRTLGAQADADLRRRCPQLPEPLVLPWSELPVLGLDGSTPWMWGSVERDPMADGRARSIVPRREIQRLRKVATLGVQFQRIGIAHELDPRGPVRDLLPELKKGPRTCTDAVARVVVGPQPPHPMVRRAARVLDTVLGRDAIAGAAKAVATMLDPIVFGVVGMPETTDGELALWYPLAAWRW